MTWFHKHKFEYFYAARFEARGETFWITIYKCYCGEVQTAAVDMKPYIEMNSVE